MVVNIQQLAETNSWATKVYPDEDEAEELKRAPFLPGQSRVLDHEKSEFPTTKSIRKRGFTLTIDNYADNNQQDDAYIVWRDFYKRCTTYELSSDRTKRNGANINTGPTCLNDDQ